jgi:hypothetical protein
MADDLTMKIRDLTNKARDQRIARDMAEEAASGNPRAVESGYERAGGEIERLRAGHGRRLMRRGHRRK